jgi:DNA polymerase
MDSNKLLKWYYNMGVEEIIENTSVISRKKAKKDTKFASLLPNPKPETISLSIAGSKEIINHAKNLAASCNSVEELKQIVTNFEGCNLKKTATNTVFSDGSAEAKIMFIGEAPGANEDLHGIPFCGDSGKLLDNMLKAIDLDRNNIYITNSIFWRPPGNRRPTPDEIAICLPFVEKHIALINPKLIILVGSTAVSAVMNLSEPMSKLRNKFFEYENIYLTAPINTIAIFHPSYLLRQPSQKKLAWRDLLLIKQHLIDNNIL